MPPEPAVLTGCIARCRSGQAHLPHWRLISPLQQFLSGCMGANLPGLRNRPYPAIIFPCSGYGPLRGACFRRTMTRRRANAQLPLSAISYGKPGSTEASAPLAASFSLANILSRLSVSLRPRSLVWRWERSSMSGHPFPWRPPIVLRNDHAFWLRTIGRLKPGVTIAQAAAPMQAVMNETMLEDVRQHAPPGTPKQVIERFLAGMRIKGVPAGGGVSSLRGEYRQPLQIMMFLVGLVLLIACSNVANLLIARGRSRQQEIVIRLSLGAGRRRIFQQLTTESLLLAAVSAGVGLLLAHWATPVFVRLLTPSTAPAKLPVGIDLRLLAFTAALALFTVLICGLWPALRLSGTDMYAAIKNGMRLQGTRRGGPRRALVAFQVALSLVLVVGAVLFTRTLQNLASSSLGFHPKQVLVTRIALQGSGGSRDLTPAWNQLLLRVRALPGVEHASLASGGLFTGEPQLIGVRTTATKALPSAPVTGLLFVSTGYFRTLGIQLVNGEDFEARDNESGAPARVIVNEAFVREFFGNENPLGRRVTKLANAPIWTKIVGVVQDAKYDSLRQGAPPMLYVPFGQIGIGCRRRAVLAKRCFYR